jgi:hypothetical protein
MQITKRSVFTGKTHTMDLNITAEQWAEYNSSQGRRLIQDIFPNLTDNEREFLMTGVTKEEWDEEFSN